MNKQRKRTQGFTLVELIVVIAILAVLAAVAIAGFANVIKNSRISNCNADATALVRSINTYNNTVSTGFIVNKTTLEETRSGTSHDGDTFEFKGDNDALQDLDLNVTVKSAAMADFLMQGTMEANNTGPIMHTGADGKVIWKVNDDWIKADGHGETYKRDWTAPPTP